jgi:hypothetical protein
VSLSMRGAIISPGVRAARGATLCGSVFPLRSKSLVLPFQRLILYLPIRVTQRLKEPFHNPCCSMSITTDVDGGRSDEDICQVVELHKSYIRIRVVEFGQQRRDALRSGSTVLGCCHYRGVEEVRGQQRGGRENEKVEEWWVGVKASDRFALRSRATDVRCGCGTKFTEKDR